MLGIVLQLNPVCLHPYNERVFTTDSINNSSLWIIIQNKPTMFFSTISSPLANTETCSVLTSPASVPWSSWSSPHLLETTPSMHLWRHNTLCADTRAAVSSPRLIVNNRKAKHELFSWETSLLCVPQCVYLLCWSTVPPSSSLYWTPGAVLLEGPDLCCWTSNLLAQFIARAV